jgi:hypothetical protein
MIASDFNSHDPTAEKGERGDVDGVRNAPLVMHVLSLAHGFL